MSWKMLLVVGAAAGGVVWTRRRRARRGALEGARWAEVTDPVTRFGAG